MLSHLLQKKQVVVLGLNSGTSADAVDMAAVKISRRNNKFSIKFLSGAEKRASRELRSEIGKISSSSKIELDSLLSLDQNLGLFYGHAAANFIRRLTTQGIKVDLLASHGQTVRHLPTTVRVSGRLLSRTCQLGLLEQIAQQTGLPVVGDFRQAAIAIGHEGAPITTMAMHRLFADRREPRLVVNIGGVANYFYFPAHRSPRFTKAADCGPGNSLTDLLSQGRYGESFDRNGRRALKGNLSRRLLTLLMGEPFFKSKRISTGREEFGLELIERVSSFGKKFNLSGEDILATLGELTTRSIALSVLPLIRRDDNLSKLYLTGGGRHNKFFVSRLRHHLPEMEILSIDELGINGDFVEAASYAVLGEACIRSEPMIESRRAWAILGKIVQPPKKKRA